MTEADHRQAFERYLHDYLVKRKMNGTAEIFKNEANLASSLQVPLAIDAPEGFLSEWWAVNYEFDFFRECLCQHGKQRPEEAIQELNASQSGQHPVNAQKNKQLLNNFASTRSKGSRSMVWHGGDKVSQNFSPSSHKAVLASSMETCLPVNVASASGQKVESLTHSASKTASISFNEEADPGIQNLLNSFWAVDQDQKVLCSILTLGEDEDNKSETSDCSSSFHRLSSVSDFSTVYQKKSNKDR